MPDENDIQKRCRERLGLRVGPEMGVYLQRRLDAGEAHNVSVIALDARTGVPLRREFDPAALRRLLSLEDNQQREQS